jgi:choice-of-anchor A domain-containing protein
MAAAMAGIMLVPSAMAGGTVSNSCNCLVTFSDIRGLVTFNGVPVSGVLIQPFCCDNCQLIPCESADPHSTSPAPDFAGFSCYVGSMTNYHVAFNSQADGGFCNSGCSTIPNVCFGYFCPLSIFLVFSYNGCTNIVSCADIAAAYQSGCGQALINVELTSQGCHPPMPPGCQPPPPPPCPSCVDTNLGLGVGAGSSVLELSAAKVSITGPPGGILGDIAIAPGGTLEMSGTEFITGTVKLGAGAKFQNSSSGVVGGVQQNVNLSAQIAAAYAANLADAALPCSQTFTTLDGKTVKTITGVSGVNVICVKDIVLSGTQISLTGPSDAKFIFNIKGKVAFTGGGAGPQIRVDASKGIPPSAVLYNLIGTGEDVALNGGGGGVNCCAAIMDGTILAPYRKIALSPGLVNGEVISGMDISIVSGSSVRCPPCP